MFEVMATIGAALITAVGVGGPIALLYKLLGDDPPVERDCCGCHRYREPFRGCRCRCHPRNRE